ncbi:saccharopine dehydrogenase family protein [Persicirhabdus sediminis]|uniref:Saccharopine dehydrogenase family protein n=1 Tax=Persicirhabdus sediminis TaxID=454144 RepID=A0A8J7ME79_9BACT|nr:saccharopine dehydrogenase family protein [Persicirhabdus sediminis]MBK1790903.1 saccharopine dehydrogenase family protein [Persicirhabdus sediminis]
MSKKVVIIGAGGVGRVVAHKCAQVPEVFGEIVLASRTKAKCDAIAAEIDREIITESVDADNVAETVALLKKYQPDLLINVALPYQDLTLMEACLEAGVDYMDTANYEPKDDPRFSYEYQWPYHNKFVDAKRMALLGSGFDPGVTNVFCAYAQKHLFDEIHTVDIIDANAGDHGLPFATNFNPEINIREITAKGRYWQEGEWKETEPMEVHQTFNFPHPEVADREIYLLYHEEMESLCKHLKGIKRLRFWMTFSPNYINHLNVLQNVGMTAIEPVDFQGQQIAPLEFLKAVLPDPGSLGPLTKGKTCIGCVFDGIKDGERKQYYIYNICDHQECYAEVKSQAISYTTGVPAMIGAKMMLTEKWKKDGVFNMEQFDPDPFMDDLNKYGLPWQVVDGKPFLDQLLAKNP